MSILAHKLRRTPQQQVGGGEFSVSFITSGGDTTNSSSYTFTDVDFGTADSTREIFVLMNWASSSSRTMSSASIGGVTATVISGSNATTSGCGIIFAEVPTGASGTISASMSGTCNNLSYGVYRVTNRQSIGNSYTDFASSGNFYSTPLSNSSNTINAGGFALGSYGANTDKTYSSSPYTLDNYNTAPSSENGWIIYVSYINTGSTQTPTQQLSWTPSGTVGIRWGLYAFDS